MIFHDHFAVDLDAFRRVADAGGAHVQLGELLAHGRVVHGPLAGAVGSAWTIAGTGDFSGGSKADAGSKGKSDILWRGPGGEVAIWFMDGATVLATPLYTQISTNWSIVATGDFNGDGKTDILWREANGAVAIWLLDGTTFLGGQIIGTAPVNWTIAGAGDFDGDGKSDILWRGPSGEVSIWMMNGPSIASGPLVGSAPTTWSIQGMR